MSLAQELRVANERLSCLQEDWCVLRTQLALEDDDMENIDGVRQLQATIAQQAATIERLTKALEDVVGQRYSELDMQTCNYQRGTAEAEAWHQGVFSMWWQLKLILAPAVAALADRCAASQKEPKP